MGRQVAPSLPGGGNKRAADPFQVRKAAMDPEGDHEESQENGKGYGLHKKGCHRTRSMVRKAANRRSTEGTSDHEERSGKRQAGYGLHSLLGFVRKESGAEPKYTLQYARLLLRRWGFTRKVPMGRHVRRANRQKIAWFRKKLKPLIEEKTKGGYAVAMQDEAIVIAEARARRGIYTPKGVRGVYTYTGSHSKTIVFGVITTDGRGYFERYSSFTKEEFVKFLKAVHAKFGKTLIILDGAAQHRAKCVKEELKKLVGLELKFLPPGCPDLNAIEEIWRQMKHAVLDIPYVTFGKMCSDIDKWLNSSMPKLDIENYLYRKA